MNEDPGDSRRRHGEDGYEGPREDPTPALPVDFTPRLAFFPKVPAYPRLIPPEYLDFPPESRMVETPNLIDGVPPAQASPFNAGATSVEYPFPPSLMFGNHGLDPLIAVLNPATPIERTETLSMQSTGAPASLSSISMIGWAGISKESAQEASVRKPWTPEQDGFLLDSRNNGLKYSQIAKEMSVRFPEMGQIKENCLVKRVQNIQLQRLHPLAQAVENAMPKIIAEIEAEIQKLESTLGVKINDGMRRQTMSAVSKQFIKVVQNKITNWNKHQRNTSLTRPADQ